MSVGHSVSPPATLNMAVLAPTATAIVAMAMAEKLGLLRRRRTAWRTSRNKEADIQVILSRKSSFGEVAMTAQNSRSRSVAITALAVAALALGLRAQSPQNPAEFVPDGAVKGSTLTGWKVVGDADWKAQNGELIGTPKAGGAGGWLVMDKGFEDVQVFTNYRCTGACKSGVLLRAKKTPDGGMKGLFVSLTDGEFGS